MDNRDVPPMPATIELSARSVAADPAALKLIPVGTRVYLVDAGDGPAALWADACLQLARADLEPVPHIACRRIRSRQDIDDRLGAMARAAGIRDALVIGGDIGRPLGPFASSMDLLGTGLLERHGIGRLGIAGHPEGSPDIQPAVIVEALHRKIDFGARTGLEIRLVTQFGFDPEATIRWAKQLAKDDVRLPIHVGVAGPTSMTRLLRYAALCGVRTSASFALKRGAALTSLLGNYEPESQARTIERRTRSDAANLVRQLHVYPFGGLKSAAQWLIARGSWNAGGNLGSLQEDQRSRSIQ